LAKCMAQGIKGMKGRLGGFVVEEMGGFDPKHPDPIERFKVPASPRNTREKPEGN